MFKNAMTALTPNLLVFGAKGVEAHLWRCVMNRILLLKILIKESITTLSVLYPIKISS
jgi:hypothetical protein